MSKRRGFAPNPDQEALPPGLRQGQWPLEPFILVGESERGRHGPCEATVGPSLTHHQWTDFKGPRPLTGGPGGKASWRVPGRSPGAFARPRPHAGPRRLRQGRAAAAGRAGGQGDVAARLPDAASRRPDPRALRQTETAMKPVEDLTEAEARRNWSAWPPRSRITTAPITSATHRKFPTPSMTRCAGATPRSRRGFQH